MPEPSNVDLAAIEARYPFLIDYTDDVLIPLIDATILETEDDVSATQFGDLRDRAIVALSAHKMLQHTKAQTGDGGPQKIISAFAAGSVSGTYVVAPPEGIAPESMHFYTTQAGVDYMALARRVGSGMRLV